MGQLALEDGFADLSLVKVELSSVKVELDDQIARESAERLVFPEEWIYETQLSSSRRGRS